MVIPFELQNAADRLLDIARIRDQFDRVYGKNDRSAFEFAGQYHRYAANIANALETLIRLRKVAEERRIDWHEALRTAGISIELIQKVYTLHEANMQANA